jgi:hypothetical protein
MNAILMAQQHRTEALSASEAQAEIFWLAFQSLPADTQQAVRKRLLLEPELPDDLAAELQSWQAAATEALIDFEASLNETQ